MRPDRADYRSGQRRRLGCAVGSPARRFNSSAYLGSAAASSQSRPGVAGAVLTSNPRQCPGSFTGHPPHLVASPIAPPPNAHRPRRPSPLSWNLPAKPAGIPEKKWPGTGQGMGGPTLHPWNY